MIYAILREDLHLPPGKAAAKLGQAMLNAFKKATPDIQQRYLSDGEGTQIVLTAPDQERILRIHATATGHGIPATLVIEKGVLMAAGIGPVARELVRPLVEDLSCMR